MATLNVRADGFRSAISAFIEARHKAKQKDGAQETRHTRAELASRYEYGIWLRDAAHRVSQIQAVTHVLKATHPDARGSSLHVLPTQLPEHEEIGTHSLGNDFAVDVVGNAAALDVVKFLKLEVDGKPLIAWMQAADPDLQAALCDDIDTAKSWTKAFASLVRGESKLVTHPTAKQVYWLVGDEPQDDTQFHLLQPMTSSSLMQIMHEEIHEARFGETNKLARQAFRTKASCDAVYRDYRGLVVRKLGGTKPQNISQLNSERGGMNYLLASLPPPAWKRNRQPRLLSQDSAMNAFLRFEGVREQVSALAKFLLENPDPVLQTRLQREEMETALGQQLAAFAATVRSQLTPGWTRNPDCCLPLFEQLWLDSDRIDLPLRESHLQQDESFRTSYEQGDWPDEVANRFAQWLNQRLRDAGLVAVGDAEHRHWARQAIVDAAWPVPMRLRAARARA